MKIANDRDLFSAGNLSQLYQQHPRVVLAALKDLGVEVALSLNGLRYYAITPQTDRELRELFREVADGRAATDELNKGAVWTPNISKH